MPDPSSTTGSDTREPSLWRSVRALLTGRHAEPSLRESLEEAIDDAEHDGGAGDMSPVERTMVRNLLHFGERSAGEVAVPRADIIAVDVTAAFDTLVAQFREAGHSRMPVYRDSLDEVIGMVHVKDVYARIADTYAGGAPARVPVAELLRPVLWVPQSMGVLELLARMRAERTHMALVIDEYGGTDGLLTIEDLMEEIVGDIEDEHDDAVELSITPAGERVWDADARMDLGELETELGVPFGDDEAGDDVDTLGGLVTALAGRVPAAGERVAHPNGWAFEVTDADLRRVARVRLHAPEVMAERVG